MRAAWLACLAIAQIHILSPPSLIDKFPAENLGRVTGTTATFGAPYYGERVKGRLRYARDERGNHHCTETEYDIPDLPGVDTEPIRVVMVDRGQCTFVTKVRIAQDYKKAQAVVVVDNEGLSPANIQNLLMADDGWGGGKHVHIPSILISSQEGDKLKAAVLSGQEVIVELAWDVPISRTVRVDFWMSSGSQEARAFLDAMKPSISGLLGPHVQFTPHYHVFALPEHGDQSNMCMDSSGRFCATPPPGAKDVTGRDVLLEDVRQYCIWETSRLFRADGSAAAQLGGSSLRDVPTFSPLYWDYLSAFHAACPVDGLTPETRFGEACATKVIQSLSVDNRWPTKLAECMQRRDTILAEMQGNVAWSPLALRINGWRFSGPLDDVQVVRAICSGFDELTKPPLCVEFLGARAPGLAFHQQGVQQSHAFFTFVVLLGSVAALFHVYKRYVKKSVRAALREEVMLEVRSQMHEYQAMEDQPQGTRVF